MIQYFIESYILSHFDCCSVGHGKDAAHTWKNDLNQALATAIGQYATLSTSDTSRRNTVCGDEAVPNFIAHPVTESQAQQHTTTTGACLGRSMSTRNMGLRVEIPQATNSARTSLATLIPPSAASTVTLFEAESIFGPIAQSTPFDTQKGYPYSKQYQTAATTQINSSCRSSIVYIKSDENPSQPVTSTDRNASPTTLVPSAVKSLVSKASTLQHKSSASANRLTAQSGLRPLSLLKDRDTNKEGDASKLAGTRPLVLGKKKQKLKATRDENAEHNSDNKYLKPLQLRRSESSKMRGMLRRDEVLPTVIVRPPSTNAKMGSPYEYN